MQWCFSFFFLFFLNAYCWKANPPPPPRLLEFMGFTVVVKPTLSEAMPQVLQATSTTSLAWAPGL